MCVAVILSRMYDRGKYLVERGQWQKRIRSPNYPAISLADAVERLTKLSGEIGTHPAPRDVVLKAMGYSGANGASLTALAALGKYGLLRREGEDFKIAERGLMYLHPQGDERSRAIHDAAVEPKLFAELNEQFSGGNAGDELVRELSPAKGIYAISSFDRFTQLSRNNGTG